MRSSLSRTNGSHPTPLTPTLIGPQVVLGMAKAASIEELEKAMGRGALGEPVWNLSYIPYC